MLENDAAEEATDVESYVHRAVMGKVTSVVTNCGGCWA
jgi:hypothetical protein